MTPLQRQRLIRRGTQVRILRRDIWEYRNWRHKRPRGRIVRVEGGYLYVRPNGWPRNRPPLELYTNEIEVLL